MSRTFRRKRVVLPWVIRDSHWVTDNETGRPHYAGQRLLQDEALRKQLRWWHEEKSCWWGARPPKFYRQALEVRHRMAAKAELIRYRKSPDYEPQFPRKPHLGYWD